MISSIESTYKFVTLLILLICQVTQYDVLYVCVHSLYGCSCMWVGLVLMGTSAHSELHSCILMLPDWLVALVIGVGCR